ncbi:hypothetical protein [Parasphingorhabdus sp.]|uniref:hypothetical protein n=1 Tax=Parasphingorhabdus sp. TaxID=2709688 RepID=UPI003265CE87
MQKSIIVVGFFLFSCTQAPPSDGLGEDSIDCTAFLPQIENKIPANEAQSNWELGNKKFLGIDDYSLSFPGLDEMDLDKRENYLNLNGYSVIEGTSDVITSEDCLLFQQQAFAYAKQYNLEIIRLSVGPR